MKSHTNRLKSKLTASKDILTQLLMESPSMQNQLLPFVIPYSLRDHSLPTTLLDTSNNYQAIDSALRPKGPGFWWRTRFMVTFALLKLAKKFSPKMNQNLAYNIFVQYSVAKWNLRDAIQTSRKVLQEIDGSTRAARTAHSKTTVGETAMGARG